MRLNKGSMYIREWKCICPEKNEAGFIGYLHETGVKDTQIINGCLGYKILRRTLDSGIEITFLSYWESLSCMKKYSGENLNTAVLYPEDRKHQIEPENRVKIYEIIESNEIS